MYNKRIYGKYYHNHDWQMLMAVQLDNYGEEEYEIKRRWYIYGNYLDEVLMQMEQYWWYNQWFVRGPYYYVQDHLYSPTALVDGEGDVLERYEYDAYGRRGTMYSDYSGSWLGSSYDNYVGFTGRPFDRFESGGVCLGYYRHRVYDYFTGRFLQQDPLGVTPNAGQPTGFINQFNIINQYKDGVNLYENVKSNPIKLYDLFGLWVA